MWKQLIIEFREACELKQEALAEMLGISQATLSRWETGRSSPSVAMRGRIMKLIREQRTASEHAKDLEQLMVSDVGVSCTLIHSAAVGDLDQVKKLVAKGVSLECEDYDKRTPLHLAAVEGHREVVSFLLSNTVDSTHTDRWGATASDCAIMSRRWDIVEMIEAYNEKHETTDHRENSAWQIWRVIQAASENDVERLRYMSRAGIDLDCTDYDQRTPLHLAAANGHEEAVTLLLSHGVDPMPLDRWGKTPFDSARDFGHEDVANIIQRA